MIGGFTLKLYQDKKHTQLITKKHFDYKTLNEALQKYNNKKVNVEYKIINIVDNIIRIEATGVVYE